MGLHSPLLSVADIDVGIIGVPYDGSVTHEPGAAEAPDALREISKDRWPLTENFVSLEQLQIRDFGDVVVDNDDAFATQKAITETVSPLVGAAIPLVLGGDHSITSAVVKAFPKDIGVLWVDSHPDLMDTYKGLKGKEESKWNHACPLRRICELPHVDTENILLLGIRDYTPEELQVIREYNIETIYAQELHTMSLGTITDRIGQKFRDIPVYISFDIDVLDPAYAPGTGVPVPGGISTRVLYDIIFQLVEKEKEWLSKMSSHFVQVAGVDLVEIAPPLDVRQITCCAGIGIIMNMLGYICLQEGLVTL
jgi:agmatinase